MTRPTQAELEDAIIHVVDDEEDEAFTKAWDALVEIRERLKDGT